MSRRLPRLLRAGRVVRPGDLPASIRAQSGSVPSPADGEVGTALELNLDDGLVSLTRQIVRTALMLEAGNKIRAAARLRISPRTVQRYVSSGRIADARVTSRTG